MAGPSSRVSRAPLVLYGLLVAAWMFDFQSEGAGQGLAIQSFILIGYLTFLAGFFLATWPHRGRIPGVAPLIICTLVYLLTAVVSGLSRGQDPYALFRHALTILVYLSSAYATARMVVQGSPALLRRVLGWLCLGYAISAFIIVLIFQGGVDISTVRYQIQGSSSIAALGLITLALVFKLSRVEVVAGAINAAMVFLSVTRTSLLVVAAQGILLIPEFRRVLRPRLLVVISAGICLLATFLMYGGESADRWVQRLFVRWDFGGEDPTYLTRLHEWQYMWDEFLSSADKFLFGSGLAAETYYWLPKEVAGGGDFYSIGFGHNQHLSLLFTAGMFGGFPLLLLQFMQGWQGGWLFAKTRLMVAGHSELMFLGAWGATIVLGTLVGNFVFSCFISRGFSLWYGVGTGLLLGSLARLKFHSESKIEVG